MITNCNNSKPNDAPPAQCQFFVLRKKRFCRMTVCPGHHYCGEHEPQPKTDDRVVDTRIPCPNDPKHTCYASKLEKHLSICNARPTELPEYIVPNINIPTTTEPSTRVPLSRIPGKTLTKVIDKVNSLYDKYIRDEIVTLEEQPIHWTVLEVFNDPTRTESSRRHLRQTSSLLHLLETNHLVQDHTCYVELGAGKGLVSYHLWQAWCARADSGSSTLLVDRAALRHKRDNKLQARVARVRADLAHLALQHVPSVRDCQGVVGIAKHLCGVATVENISADYALQCVTAPGVVSKTRGVVVATCCHHRCEPHVFLGRKQLQDLGITDEDFNVMLGIVSWATCGDGRPRGRRKAAEESYGRLEDRVLEDENSNGLDHANEGSLEDDRQMRQQRAETGRRARAALDWARARALRQRGLRGQLVRFVPDTVSPENIAIVAVRTS